MHRIQRIMFMGLVVILLGSLLPVIAQEETPVTAEVLYPEVNLRAGPSLLYASLGLLPQRATVTVHAWENYLTNGTEALWVYVTVTDSGLVGWIRADMLYFSDAQWRRHLPTLGLDEVARTILTESYLDTYEFELWNNGSDIQLYAEPWEGSPVIDLLPSYSLVTVIGRSIVQGYNRFVYMQYQEKTGWVRARNLRRIAARPITWSDALPIVAAPFPIQGQMIAIVWDNFRLRSEPNLTGNVIVVLDVGQRLAVHGRSSNEDPTWVYVTVLPAGQSGWVLDRAVYGWRSILYPRGFTVTMLPLLPPVANPPIPPTVETLPSLSAVTKVETSWLITPFRRESVAEIPPGTTVTIRGRLVASFWFWASYEGIQGWVRYDSVDIQGDFNRLPIID